MTVVAILILSNHNSLLALHPGDLRGFESDACTKNSNVAISSAAGHGVGENKKPNHDSVKLCDTIRRQTY